MYFIDVKSFVFENIPDFLIEIIHMDQAMAIRAQPHDILPFIVFGVSIKMMQLHDFREPAACALSGDLFAKLIVDIMIFFRIVAQSFFIMMQPCMASSAQAKCFMETFSFAVAADNLFPGPCVFSVAIIAHSFGVMLFDLVAFKAFDSITGIRVCSW